MDRKSLLTSLALLTGGIPAGLLAWKLGAPIPFLAGPIVFAAAFVVLLGRHIPQKYVFAPRIRVLVMAIIGVAIGTQATPPLLRQLPDYIPSLLALSAFVPLVHFLNYKIMRRTGGLSKTDAFFSALPGGFVESLLMTEQYGGTVRIVTMQHFLRIILVIGLIPIVLSFYVGFPVGRGATSKEFLIMPEVWDVALMLAYAAAGFFLARRVHLPAGHLIGPLLITATVSGTGFLPTIEVAPMVIAAAQIIVGLSLGSRFAGIQWAELRRAAQSSLLCILLMLAIGFALSELIHIATGVPLEILFLTFAPGGVTEMGLIALSLSGNPAVVVMHHVYRIIFSVLLMNLFLRTTGFLTQPKA